jgi:hypothetical protein
MGTLLVVGGTVAILMVWGAVILKIVYASEKSRVLTPAQEEAVYNKEN